MIVIGFDPGLATAGLAIVEFESQRPRVLYAETIRTEPDVPLEERLGAIWARLSKHATYYGPAAVGVEDQADTWRAQSRRGNTNAKGMIPIRVCGLADAAAFLVGARLVYVTPQQVKLAVLGPGSRSAEKPAVKAIVSRWAGTLKLSEHSADAIAIAVAARRRIAETVRFEETRARAPKQTRGDAK